jgi:hypothetical protein
MNRRSYGILLIALTFLTSLLGWGNALPTQAQGPTDTTVVNDSVVSDPTSGTGQLESTASTISLSPKRLPLESSELVNPMRGLYRWREQEYATQPQPSYDAYHRYSWRQIEPKIDQYDFSELDRDIAEAASQGRKFAFRIRAMVHDQGLMVPDYLVSGMAKGWWGDVNNDGKGDTYVPDWNDSYFLKRVEKLATVLGERYDKDPRISWVEVGLYGNWGEWHMWPFLTAYPRPSGAQEPSEESKRLMIDAIAKAFPTTQVIMGTGEAEALVYALQTYPQMGWRRDSMGDPHFTEGAAWNNLRKNPEHWKLVTERWKSAPIITEFINPSEQRDPDVYRLALEHARDYHVSLVSNGNTLEWDSLSQTGKNLFVQLGKMSGYRYELVKLTVPAALGRGASFTIEAAWHNSGNAPTYEDWQVVYQLRAPGSKSAVWESSSSLNLRTLLPTQTEAAVKVTDQLRLTSSVPAGNYDLIVIVRDPSKYRAPLKLAIEGAQSDGSYKLGTITVSSTQLQGQDAQIYLPMIFN